AVAQRLEHHLDGVGLTARPQRLGVGLRLGGDHLRVGLTAGPEHRGGLLTLGAQDGRLLQALRAEDLGALVPVGAHLLLHRLLDRLRGLDGLELDPADLDAPLLGGVVEDRPELAVDLVPGGEGLLQVHAADHVAQRRRGELFDGLDEVRDLIGGVIGIGHPYIDRGVHIDGKVVLGDRRLRREAHHLDAHVDALPDVVHERDHDVESRFHVAVVPAEPLHHEDHRLRDDAQAAPADDEQDRHEDQQDEDDWKHRGRLRTLLAGAARSGVRRDHKTRRTAAFAEVPRKAARRTGSPASSLITKENGNPGEAHCGRPDAPFPLNRYTRHTARAVHRSPSCSTFSASPKVSPRLSSVITCSSGPASTTRPPRISSPWVNPGGISSTWCEPTTRAGASRLSASRPSRRSRSSRPPRSRPAAGSSSSSSSGSAIIARAISTRLRSPSDSVPNRRPSRESTPHWESSARARPKSGVWYSSPNRPSSP